MKAGSQAKCPWRGVSSLWLLLVGMFAGCEQPQAAPALASAGAVEPRPVVLGRLDLNRLKGDVVCVYNFSSW